MPYRRIALARGGHGAAKSVARGARVRVVLGALASAALLGAHRQAPQRGLLRWRFLKSRAPTGYSVRTLYRILAGGRPRHLVVFARTSEIAPSVCGGASPRLARCERGAGMLRSLLGLGLLATLCAAADETVSARLLVPRRPNARPKVTDAAVRLRELAREQLECPRLRHPPSEPRKRRQAV